MSNVMSIRKVLDFEEGEKENRLSDKELRKSKLRETHGQLSQIERLEEKIEFIKTNQVRLSKLDLWRMKSAVQTYDIRDSESYSDVIEIERIMKAQMIQQEML